MIINCQTPLSSTFPLCRHCLYTISRSDKNGVPIVNLSLNMHTLNIVVYSGETQVKTDKVVMKIVRRHHSSPSSQSDFFL